MRANRSFTDEEIDAVKWKLNIDQAQPAQEGPPVVAGSLSFEDCVFAAENGVQAVEVDADLSDELLSSTDNDL